MYKRWKSATLLAQYSYNRCETRMAWDLQRYKPANYNALVGNCVQNGTITLENANVTFAVTTKRFCFKTLTTPQHQYKSHFQNNCSTTGKASQITKLPLIILLGLSQMSTWRRQGPHQDIGKVQIRQKSKTFQQHYTTYQH